MIQLTKLNGEKILINPDLIEYVISNPDTVITLLNGNKFVVKESLSDVIEEVVKYRKKIAERDIIRRTAQDNEKEA